MSKSIQIGWYGHEFEDDEIFVDSKEKTSKKSSSFFKQIHLTYAFVKNLLFSGRIIRNAKRKAIDEIDLLRNRKFNSAKEVFDVICQSSGQYREVMDAHGVASMTSILSNVGLLNFLSSVKDNSRENVYSDFSQLTSSASEVISADVPNSLKEIALLISNPNQFKEMSDDKALEYLNNANDECCIKFREFLVKHGHRGYKEFDIYAKQWGDNPMIIIKSLKSMVGNRFQTKETKSTNDIIKSLKTPLSAFKRFILRRMLLPWTLSTVTNRETSKYTLIWSVNMFRKAFWAMAELMVKEGRLPDADLMFHLTFPELEILVNERDPIIVARAKQRRRLFPKKDALLFNETVIGPNIKARNEIDDLIIPNINSDDISSMKGTAVSSGKVKARVCVAMNLVEAQNIQSGDILITYSTDIGWSPYFPMLSGLATEIGGLVSHGAVIAREYGLPCIIGVEGASKIFKSGDIVLLDADNGVITKIE